MLIFSVAQHTVIPGRLRENADVIAHLKERFGDPDAGTEPQA
ncbi:hypothetical protein [Streptomyces sp. NPDC048606]